MSEHQLRDLARKIEQLAMDHPAYGQGASVVQNCCDHLCAIARTHEANAQLANPVRLILKPGPVTEQECELIRAWLRERDGPP